MRCTTFALLAFSTLSAIVECAPFVPGGGNLQRLRRDAIDYPFQADQQFQARRLQRRDLPYSVVQVNGDAQATTSAQPVVTVTDIQIPATVTTTVAHNAVPSIVTETVKASPQPTTTSATTLRVVFKTVVETKTAQPSSSVSYYDDGLWHTSYPVKTFGQPTATSTTQLPDATAVLTVDGVDPVALKRRGEENESIHQRRSPATVDGTVGGLTHTEEEGLRRFMA